MVTRCEFLSVLTASCVAPSYAASGFSSPSLGAGSRTTIADAPTMKYGYAAITWGAQVTQAIEDIAAVGFKAIQLRGEAFAELGDRPKELRALLDRHHLTFAVLSSGNLSIDPAREQEVGRSFE